MYVDTLGIPGYTAEREDSDNVGDEDVGDGDGDMIDAEEDAPIQTARDLGDPTPREREEHCVTHVPYRSWCTICVKAKGKEEAHKKMTECRSNKPTIIFDYKSFVGQFSGHLTGTHLFVDISICGCTLSSRGVWIEHAEIVINSCHS